MPKASVCVLDVLCEFGTQLRAFGLQLRQFCLLFGRQFGTAEDEIAQVVVELGLLRRGEGVEFGRVLMILKRLYNSMS